MRAGWTRILIGGAVVTALLAAGTVITIADTGGVIFACVNNANGSVRIVAQQVSCKPNETAAHWNVIGPQGPPGPQGPAGPQGPPGQSGSQQQVVGVVTVHSTLRGDDITEAIGFTTGISESTGSGGGALAGRPVADPATFTKVVDKTSPDLFELLGRDESVSVRVELCNTVTTRNGAPSCSGTPYATYLYEMAKITKLTTTTPPAFANTAEEEVTVVYGKLTFTVDSKTVIFEFTGAAAG